MKKACKIVSPMTIALVVLLSSAGLADAGIIMTISDNGTDLTMTATGTYDVSSLIPTNGPALGGNAAVVAIAGSGTFGWETGITDEYPVTFSGYLTATFFAIDATSVSGSNPFTFWTQGSSLGLPSGAPQIGSVNETATFAGVTLASLGMVAGETVNVSWTGDSAIIQTIPEPASVGLLGLGSGLMFFIRRRTKTGTKKQPPSSDRFMEQW